MNAAYTNPRQEIDRIVAYQMQTNEQFKALMERGKRHFDALPEEKKIIKEQFHSRTPNGVQVFYSQIYTDPGESIGVFMDFRSNLKNDPEGSAPMHVHNYFEMFYVYRGHCFSTIEGKEREFKAGDFCLYSLQAKHLCYLPSNQDVVFNFIIQESSIDDTFLELLSNNDVFSKFFIDSLCSSKQKNSIYFSASNYSDIAFYIFKMIITYYNSKPYNKNLMKSLLICLFNEIALQYKQQLDELSQNENKGISISSVIDYIETNYKTVTLQSTAEHFYYSPRSLSQFIQKHTDKKFSQIIQDIKLKKTCQLLKNTEVSLDEISSIVGYNDRHYLDKLFRKAYGISLIKYRKFQN